MNQDKKAADGILDMLMSGHDPRSFQTATGGRMSARSEAQKDQGGYDIMTGVLSQLLGWGAMGAGALTMDPLIWGGGAAITPMGYNRMVNGGKEYKEGLDTRNDALFAEDRILRSKGQSFKSPYLSGGRSKRPGY